MGSGRCGSSRSTRTASWSRRRTPSNKRPISVKTSRNRPIDPPVTRRPFNFRLERVRALRESFEDQAREELADSLHVRLKGEAMLRAASELPATAQAGRRDTVQLEVTGAELRAAH